MGGGKNVPVLTSGFSKNCPEPKCQNTIFFCNSVRTLLSSTISQRCRSMRLFSYYWINPFLEIRPISPLLIYVIYLLEFSFFTTGRRFSHFSSYANRVLKYNIYAMGRLDQGHLHPKLEVSGLSCPGRESNPSLTLEKSHQDSLLMAVRNMYST